MKRFSFLISLPFFAIFFLYSCGHKTTTTKIDADLVSYIYAYTSGTIEADEPIRVRFAVPAVSKETVGKAVDTKLFMLQPSIRGTTIWEDEQTLVFKPEQRLPNNTGFSATVALRNIFKNLPVGVSNFTFEFHTRALFYALNVEGVQSNSTTDLAHQTLRGDITTNEKADDKQLESILIANQDGKNLVINWTHESSGLLHHFFVKDIQRTQQQSSVVLTTSGDALGIQEKKSETITLPSLGVFSFLKATVFDEGEPYFKINFSDPLSASQDLNGLIRIADYYGNYRYTIDGNSVSVYTNNRLLGARVITVSEGIKNFEEKKLGVLTNFTLNFSDVKPQVRLVGSGNILPTSDGLIFPFEATNLNYVDVEVLKIFNNNILQFLQTNNDVSGEYDLERVGRIVMQKRVELKQLNPQATTTDWSRFGIDLTSLVKDDPQAIYQVRIGFRRSYTNYDCKTKGNDDLKGMNLLQDAFASGNSDDNNNSFDGSEKSIMRYGWNGGENQKTNGNTQNANDDDGSSNNASNPCLPTYYNSENFIKRNILSSNVGLLVKQGKDNSLFCAVTDLRTAETISGASVELYDYQQQKITEAKTDGNGTVIFRDMKQKPWAIIAKQGNERGYLTIQNNTQLSLARFDVAGSEVQKGLKGYLYGERGVWRPGDTMHLNFILNDKDNILPQNYPITLELLDPKGIMQSRTTSFNNVKKIYPLNISTSSDAPTGRWTANVKAGGAVFSTPIRIETVKPNRLKILLETSKQIANGNQQNAAQNGSVQTTTKNGSVQMTTQNGLNVYSSEDDAIKGTLKVNWLYGAPARSLKAKIEATTVSTLTKFNRGSDVNPYPNYIFDDPTRSIKSDNAVIFDGNVDENGTATISMPLPKNNNAPGKMRIGMKMRAFEAGGDFSSDYQAFDYFPYKNYVGVSIPIDQNKEKRIDINKTKSVDIIVVDKNGMPVRNKRVDVGVYRVEWHWWWEQSNRQTEEFQSGKNLAAVLQKTVTTDGSGKASVDVNVTQWGRYLVRAGDLTGGHFSGDFFYAGYPWDDENEGSNTRNNIAMLNFSTNKDNYAVGENVEITLPTPESGKALITIENGTSVVESHWIKTERGSTKYSFKATEAMTPNVYAFVTLLQPHNTVKNDLPIRMYGVAPISVKDPNAELHPIVKLPDVIKPEEKVTIEVSEKNNRAMAYTIALVDEGLLDITRFETPNPFSIFYAKEALGIQTFDMFDKVLGSYSGTLQKISTVGGDKAAKQKNAQVANRFKPVVLTLGPFFAKNGSARHEVTIPNYIGALRAMVVVSDGARSFGSAEQTVSVRKPLMVLPTVPRVLAHKENFQLPINVFALEPKIRNVNVTVSDQNGLIHFKNGNSKSITFDKPTDKMVFFDCEVPETDGVAKIHVVVEGGGERATQDIEVQVRNPNPTIVKAQDAVLAPGQSFNFNLQKLVGDKTDLEISSMPPLNLSQRLNYLLEYPYGCAEQTTSAVFPQLYVDKILNLDDAKRKTIAANIANALERLHTCQTAEGGFSMWPGGISTDQWITNYVGHFLIEAKATGYTLPPNMLDRWLKWQQRTAKMWASKTLPNDMYWAEDDRQLSQAYRLFTLALNKTPENAEMNALRESKTISAAARWRLGAAYALIGKTDIAKQITNNLDVNVQPYREMYYTYGSNLRDQAMILETTLLYNDKTQAYKLAFDISKQLNSSDWYNTQETAFALQAMSKFATKFGIENGGVNVDYKLNSSSNILSSNNTINTRSLQLAAQNTLSVHNSGKSQTFVRVVQRGKSTVGTVEPNRSSNVSMSVQYKNAKGEAVNINSLQQGTDFVAEVTVTNLGKMGKPFNNMVLAQVFPSGWEILNERLEGAEAANTGGSPFDYRDIRDDHVNTFFNVDNAKSRIYKVRLNAAYIGHFWLPAQLCESMYNNAVSATTQGSWVDVKSGNKEERIGNK